MSPRSDESVEEVIVSTVYDGKRRKLLGINCSFCGKVFYAPKHVGRKYCSKKCSLDAIKARRVALVCDGCGAPFTLPPNKLNKSKSGLHFCSRKCKDEAQRMGNYNAILRPSHYNDGRYSYREIARRTYPMICNRCGYDEYPGILRVHHRDRGRTNNKPDNLEILCPNCHEVEHYSSEDGLYTRHRKAFGDSAEAEKRLASDS